MTPAEASAAPSADTGRSPSSERCVMYSVAMSLDGFIAGPNGEYDWIPDEPAIDWEAFLARFDTMVMGRKTYEIVAGAGEGGSPPLPGYVFSSTLEEVPEQHLTLVKGPAAATVRELKNVPGKRIWLLGGGALAGALLAEGLVDEVEVALVPVLLGDGVPLLPALRNAVVLELEDSHTYPGGITLLRYRVRPEASTKTE